MACLLIVIGMQAFQGFGSMEASPGPSLCAQPDGLYDLFAGVLSSLEELPPDGDQSLYHGGGICRPQLIVHGSLSFLSIW